MHQRISTLLNLIFPPQCLSCEILVPTHGTLCNTCWKSLHFITAPMCACCGLPFEYEIGEGALCAACIADPPAFSKARSILVFDDASKSLVHKLKFQDETYLARILSQWMVTHGRELIASADVIIPVPLHRLRLLSRRYNQSALLAALIGKEMQKPCKPEWLQRIKHTKPQAGLNKSERADNVKSAFIVPDTYKPELNGKRILLIDDVMTTGATIDACIKALLKAGAADVDVLTLTRVSRVG